MKRKLLSVIMALAMMLTLLPATAFAAENGTKLPDAANGVITLDEDVALSNTWVITEDTVLELAGHKLSSAAGFSDGALIDVQSGSLTVQDSSVSGEGTIEVNETRYMGTDHTSDPAIFCVEIEPGAEMTLLSGKVTNSNKASESSAVICNYGTLNLNGGTVEGVFGVSNRAPTRFSDEGDYTNLQAVCTIDGGTVQGVPCTYYKGDPLGDETGWSWGVGLFGPGLGAEGTGKVNNDAVVLNVRGSSTISAAQAIGTNASSGRYAGNTINISGGRIDGGADGTGMYLPAIGVTNISDGTIIGAQGIRICAGELNVTGGTIEGTALANDQDLVAGGSGGTAGAIVIGKASNGYIGDVAVNISESATVTNTASGDGVKPAIVVSDKHMAETGSQTVNDPDGTSTGTTYDYSDYSISVVVDGQVTGDVVKISNLTQADEDRSQDGGATSVEITGTVNGNVINQTDDGDLTINGGTVAGNVDNQSTGDVVIQDAKVDSVTNTGDGTTKGAVAILKSTVETAITDNAGITIVDSTVGGQEITSNYVSMVGATGYKELSGALDAVKDSGGTITLLKDAPLTNADYDIAGDVTITGSGKITVDVKDPVTNDQANPPTTTYYHAFTIKPNASLTLDGVAMEISGQGYGIDIQYDSTLTLDGATLNIDDVSNATISSKPSGTTNPGTINVLNGSTITATNINGNFSNGGVWTIKDSTVTIQDCTSHGFSASAIIVDNATVNISNTGRRGISINDDGGRLEVVNGASVSVSNTCTSGTDGDYAVSMNSKATGGIQVAEGSTLRVSGDIKLNTTATNNLAGVTVTDGSITGGEAMVDGKAYVTLADALEAVSTAVDKTVTLLQNVTVSDKIVIDDANVTLDGDGHSITVSTNADFVGQNQTPPVNSVLEVLANNVTIQDVELIGTAGKTKHGVQFYNVEGGKLSGVTVTGTAWTGVLVNASKVTIENSVLNPTGDGVYATIEYAMGNDTLTRIPELHLNNVSSDSGIKVWADNATVTRVINKSAEADTAAKAAEEIRGNITTENNVAITISIDVNNDADHPVDTTVPSTKPSNGGSSGGSSGYAITAEKATNGSVSVSPSRASAGSTVTVTVKPDNGYELGTLTVTDNDGDRITLTDKGNGKYTFTMPRGAVTVKATFVEETVDTGYSDVSASAWYADAVAYVTDNGMMQGNAGRFMPNDNLDRAMMAQILYNLEDNPAVNGGSAFGDVGSGSWYADAVAWASANSVITGYDNGNYGPNDSITREQMALMLYRYAALKGYETTQSGAGLTGFADAESVSSWASEAMTWAVNAGVINGKDGNRLDPQGTATRAEVAQVLMNFGQNVMP